MLHRYRRSLFLMASFACLILATRGTQGLVHAQDAPQPGQAAPAAAAVPAPAPAAAPHLRPQPHLHLHPPLRLHPPPHPHLYSTRPSRHPARTRLAITPGLLLPGP